MLVKVHGALDERRGMGHVKNVAAASTASEGESARESAPLDLYVDQMVFSTASRTTNWRTDHYLGTLIEPLVRSGRVCVRPSLAHHSETLLHVDADEDAGCVLRDTARLDERKRLADLIWQLSDFGRPTTRWEVFALRELGDVLSAIVPAAVFRDGLDKLRDLDRDGLREKMRRLATNRDEHDPSFYAHAWSAKLTTQLAQARLREKNYLATMLDAVDKGTKASRSVFDDLDQWPLSKLRAHVSSELARLAGCAAKDARTIWQKNRKKIDGAYTIDALVGTLAYFMASTEQLPPVFDIGVIAANWPLFEGRAGKMVLPEPLPDVNAAMKAGMTRDVIVGRLLQPLVERLLGPADLPTSRSAMYIASLQIEDALADHPVGTGNVFDCERAIALHEVRVFHSNDAALVRHARRAAKQFQLNDVAVCEGEKELARTLDRILA